MRKLAVFAGSFSLGIFLAQYLLRLNQLLPAALLCLLMGCGALLLPREWRRRGVLCFSALAWAFGYHWLYCDVVQQPMTAFAGTENVVNMVVCDYAVPTDYGAKATVRIDGQPAKAVYYGEELLLDVQPGQIITDTVYFQDAAKIRDTEITTFTSKNVFLLAYQRGEAVVSSGTETSPRWWPVKVCRSMQTQITALFDEEAGGFLTAILTGEKTGLSVQAGNDLSEAGIYHLMAVSGMHCGFLLALVTLLLGRHRRRLIAACAIPMLVFYALLTGGSPSVIRACIMLSFLIAAPLFHRESDGPTALTAALAVILLQNPFAAASIGLQLSFSAMAGILWLTPKLYRWMLGGKKHSRAYVFVAASFSATMGALAFSIPLSAHYFGFLVLIAPVSNLLCLWAAGIVFIAGLTAVVLGFLFQPLAIPFAFVSGLLVKYILWVAHLLAKIPYHAVYFDNPYLACWLAFTYLLFAVAYLGKKRRGYAIAVFSAVLTLMVTVYLCTARYDGRLETVMLDVGQGQSVILSSGKDAVLVDCGSANSWYGAGSEAADYLLTMGHQNLDYLILTHYDSDHINGVAQLFSRMKVGECLLPAAADADGLQAEILCLTEEYGIDVRLIDEKTDISIEYAGITVFPPVGDALEDNEQGLSVLTTLEEQSLLITGDMDRATEKRLLETYDLPKIEILAAGHHGSKSATSAELLDALAPEMVCISVGDNSYGHPSEEMLRRLAERDCTVYRTDLHGDIRLSWK